MTKDEAWDIVNANRVLFPMDFLKFSDVDYSNLAMLYAKALGSYPLQDVREAFIDAAKVSQHCIKIADMYARLGRSRGRDAMLAQNLRETKE